LEQSSLYAVDYFDKFDLTELAGFKSPPDLMEKIMSTVVLMFNSTGKSRKDLSRKSIKNLLLIRLNFCTVFNILMLVISMMIIL
jgi:hypothetical protein